MDRPLGVIALAILSLVSGAWSLLKGLAWLGIGGAAAGVVAGMHPVAGVLLGGVALFFGLLALVSALSSLIFSWGAWNLRPWAHSLGMATHGTILVWSLLAVLGPGLLLHRWGTILISGVILYYLTRPEIKRAFGKA